MSSIINTAESLSLEQKTSIAQTKSQSGRRVAQKRGPTLYNLEVEVGTRRLNDTVHRAIEDEIIDLGYGAETFNSANVVGSLPASITGVRGDWTGGVISSLSGTQVVFSSLIGTPEKQDFFQTGGSTKVYQVADYDDLTKTITLNSAIIGTAIDFVVGSSVNFNFALIERPRINYLPGDLVQYGTFVFEEVIE